MRIALPAITAFCLVSTAALACDDHFGTCEIEDWKTHLHVNDAGSHHRRCGNM